MAMNIPWSFGFQRMEPDPLDPSLVFDTLADFQTYLTGGTAYAGQVVAVRNGTNVPDVYVVNNDGHSYTEVGVGGGGPFEYPVSPAATVWLIPHQMGQKYVSAQIVDSAGRTVIPDIDWAASTANALQLVFANAKSGTAIIRR